MVQLPSEVLVPKVEAFDGVECLTLFESEWAALITSIFKPLECVKVAAIFTDKSSGITALFIKRRHFDPPLVENVKFFAVCHHFFLIITATDYIDVAVAEVVVRRERSPPHPNIGHSLDRFSCQVKYECVMNRSDLWLVDIIARNYQ